MWMSSPVNQAPSSSPSPSLFSMRAGDLGMPSWLGAGGRCLRLGGGCTWAQEPLNSRQNGMGCVSSVQRPCHCRLLVMRLLGPWQPAPKPQAAPPSPQPAGNSAPPHTTWPHLLLQAGAALLKLCNPPVCVCNAPLSISDLAL